MGEGHIRIICGTPEASTSQGCDAALVVGTGAGGLEGKAVRTEKALRNFDVLPASHMPGAGSEEGPTGPEYLLVHSSIVIAQRAEETHS